MKRIYAVLMVLCFAALGCAYYSKTDISIKAETFKKGAFGLEFTNGEMNFNRTMDSQGISKDQCLQQTQ